MLSQGYGCILMPFHRLSWPQIWPFWVTWWVEMKPLLHVWGWYDNDIHLRPVHASILNIYKVFEPFICCLKGIWVHPYTVQPAKLAPDLTSLGRLWSRYDASTSWLRLAILSNGFPHPHWKYTMCLSNWYSVCRYTLAALHHYTGQVDTDLGILGYLTSLHRDYTR
jgi:hypothetical protein